MLAKLKRAITKISSHKRVQFADALQLGAKTDTDRAQTDTMNIQDAKVAVDKEWEKLQKLPEWQVMKVKSRKEVFQKAQKEKRTVHFATLTDLCHLKNSKLEQQFQKHKGRVVFRGDDVIDDSGSYAVFTEQGSSASKIDGRKFWTSSPDYLVAQDKQATPYPPTPKSKWRTLRHC